VEKALSPYLDVLDRVSRFLGETPVRRGAGRPRSTAAAGTAAAPKRRTRRGRRRAGAAAADKGDVSQFTEGQQVKYRQGRGEFEATIAQIDRENSVLILERKGDKKRVQRPPAKVYAA